MVDLQTLQRVLPNVRPRYQDEARVYQDSAEVMNSFPHLRPGTAVRQPSDSILCLRGTISITHAGSTFHIPLNMYMPKEYPALPPAVYVDPKPGMELAHNHIYLYPDGRCVVRSWGPTATAARLMWDLKAQFDQRPPVFATGAQPPSAPQTQRAQRPHDANAAQQGYHPPSGYSTHPGRESRAQQPNTGYPAQNPYAGIPSARPQPSGPPMPSGPPPPASGPPPSLSAGRAPRVQKQETEQRERPAPSTSIAEVDPVEEVRRSQVKELNTALQRMCGIMRDSAKAECEKRDQEARDLEAEIKQREAEICRSDAQEVQLDAQVKALQDEATKLEQWIVENAAASTNPVAAMPSDPLSCQVLELRAEREALEDALNLLTSVKGMPADTFVSTVLKLAHKKFYAEALLNKIAKIQAENAAIVL